MRRRCVDRVWLEEITIVNHRRATSAVRVELDVDTDFADLFEVKDGAVAPRDVTWREEGAVAPHDVTLREDGASLVLEYRHEAFQRSVTITSNRPAEISRHGFAFGFVLERGAQWTVALRITPYAAQQGTTFAPRTVRGSVAEVRRAKAAELEQWLARAPVLRGPGHSIGTHVSRKPD